MEILKQKKRLYIKILWGLFFTPILLLIVIFTLVSKGSIGFMPGFEALENPQSSLATQVFSSDGELLGTYFKENRSKANYSELSPYLINALLCTEDVRFLKHSGVDFMGLTRVAVKTVLGGNESSGGGSTITQQLAKMLFPRERFDNAFSIITRKFREWVIAIKLEKSYTKEEIIAMYLNQFDFLNLAVGINSASTVYFNTSPKELKIEEAAMLVGMAKNPSLFNPIRRPDTTLHRRNVVLKQMLKYEKITVAEYDSIKELPLNVQFQKVDHKLGIAPYFREYLRIVINAKEPFKENFANYDSYQQDSARWADDPLYGWCNKNKKADGTTYNLYEDGLKIHTTINSRMQKYAEIAVSDHLKNVLQKKFFAEQKGRRRAPYSSELSAQEYNEIVNASIKSSERYENMKVNNISHDSIMKAFRIKTKMQIYTWEGLVDTILTPLDSIKHIKHYLHAGFLSMEPHTGHIKAWVGGIDYRFFQYDHVKRQKRQVGSTFKPFLYTLAMQDGISPCHKVANVPTTFYFADTTWTPGNSDDARVGEMVTLSWGLANSNNNVSARLMKQFKPRAVINIAKEMGITSYIPEVPAICLGVADISLYEMVGAYSTYANKGIYTEPIFVSRIEDRHGNIISTFTPQRNEAISKETAYLMLKLMEDVVRRGTSVRLRYHYNMLNEIAGKTGTTNDHSDGWFIGLAPKLVSGVWVGGDERSIRFESIRDGQGANMALPIWGTYMQQVYADSLELNYFTAEKFERPASIPFDRINCNHSNENSSIQSPIIKNNEIENPEFY